MSNVYAGFEADRAAVATINFCSVWPPVKPILQQLASVVKNPLVKIAIRTVIGAGDAYCGATKAVTNPATERLMKLGLQGLDYLSDDQITALEGMSDADLSTLVQCQKAIDGNNLTSDEVGGCLF
ncbi:MAG: hypothetical protein RLZZ141_2128 [Pseudomonadota bacterium]